MKTTLLALFASTALVACAGNPLKVDNRIACTLAGDQMLVVGSSPLFWGGGAVPINPLDAGRCKEMAAAPSKPASGVAK